MHSYDDIAACAAQYAATRKALFASHDSLRDYEAVLRARVTLAESLIACGWSPPEDVNHLLMLDRALLAEPRGVIEERHALIE